MPLVLEIRGLGKSFGARSSLALLRLGGRRRLQVLAGVDLALEPGARVGLCGPNGSGKSTLLRIVAGIEPPDTGLVRLFGATPADPAARRRIGFLPEASPFPAELSARAALELFASLHGFGRRERHARVAASLERVGLADQAARALGRFSKGMLRRFGLAHAFLAEPDLVLLDEPTAGLDAAGHVLLDELLRESAARGATLLFASHHYEDVARHAERAVVLVDGRIVADGTPAGVLGGPERTLLEIEGLDATAIAELAREVARRGGRVVERHAGGPDLVDLLRRSRERG